MLTNTVKIEEANYEKREEETMVDIVWITAFLAVFSYSITPDYDYTASAKDLFFYRLSGSLLFAVFAIAFLIQTDIFGIKQKLGLESIKKKVLFWIATFVISITAFIL